MFYTSDICFVSDITEPTSSKKQKVQYVYRTPEDVIEEMNKNNSVHKMAREYRYLRYMLSLFKVAILLEAVVAVKFLKRKSST